MEGKVRYEDPSQPYVVHQCSKCNQNMVVTAAGNTKHICSK
jgi:hypothetical protein